MSNPSEFTDFGLSEELLKSIADMGYTAPTDVQVQSLPPLLEGKDLIVQSRTGTGKTAAFGIPMIEKIDASLYEVQAVVLCPTRELALQVHEEIAKLGKHKGVLSFPIYGGASMKKQIDALHAGLHVVVGTPGRVLDHLRTRHLSFKAVHYLCLDEADEMLSMGFYEEVSSILAQVPERRQTMLFSATIPPGVEGIIYKHQHEPERLMLSSDNVLVAEVNHAYYVCPTMEKPQTLARILLHEEPTSAIIFVNTRADARVVTAFLKKQGFEADMISGELAQRDREKVMGKIKRKELRYMVATDVAARGIDISDLSHVINYSAPENRDVYVHRTGRTGRVGKSGTALTLVGLRDLPKWSEIEKMKGLTIEERKAPSKAEVVEEEVDHVIYAARHAEKPILPAEEVDVVPPPVEEHYTLAAERLLEQGIDTDMLARLLHKALVPPIDELVPPEAVEANSDEAGRTDAASDDQPTQAARSDDDNAPQRRRRRRRSTTRDRT